MTKLFLILGKSGRPLSSQLYSEKEIEAIASEMGEITVFEVECPWHRIDWALDRSQGNRAAFGGLKQTTMRVPIRDRELIKRFAIWLSRQ